MMDDAIRTDGLAKRYNAVRAVQDLSLAVRPGEIYGFIGLNGSGKTTTIRMLLGMIRPTNGTARLFGTRVSPGARVVWSQVGYMVETPHAYGDITVRENLDIARRLHGLSDPRAVERTMQLLALTAYADSRAGQLSLGNAQRLGLAKALLHTPRLLILDEPSNGLDPEGVVEVRELLREHVRRNGGTVFMSSHVLGEVARLATRIGIIHQGRMLEELSATELERRCVRWLEVDARDRCAARATLAAFGFVVDSGPDGALTLRSERAVERPDDIARMLVGNGVSPTRLSVETEDLEAHFLRIVRRGNEDA